MNSSIYYLKESSVYVGSCERLALGQNTSVLANIYFDLWLYNHINKLVKLLLTKELGLQEPKIHGLVADESYIRKCLFRHVARVLINI